MYPELTAPAARRFWPAAVHAPGAITICHFQRLRNSDTFEFRSPSFGVALRRQLSAVLFEFQCCHLTRFRFDELDLRRHYMGNKLGFRAGWISPATRAGSRCAAFAQRSLRPYRPQQRPAGLRNCDSCLPLSKPPSTLQDERTLLYKSIGKSGGHELHQLRPRLLIIDAQVMLYAWQHLILIRHFQLVEHRDKGSMGSVSEVFV